MSPTERERTLVEHAFERRGDTWVPRAGGDELADQVVSAATETAGAHTVSEIIIDGVVDDMRSRCGACTAPVPRGSGFCANCGARTGWGLAPGSIAALVGIVLLVVLLVLAGYGLGAWLDGRNDDQAAEPPASSAATTSTSTTTTTTSNALAVADPDSGGSASTVATTTSTSTSSTSTTSTTPASTTTVPSAFVVAVSADDALHDARFLANLDAVNVDRPGVTGRWYSPWFPQSQSAGGSITIDPDDLTFSVALTESWTCDGVCQTTFDSSVATLTASGSGELRPDGSGWLIEGTVALEYSAQLGQVESPSTCGGEPCYLCTDRFCRWDSRATASVPLTGRIDGTAVRIAFVDGLADDIATMDFTDLRTTEFFMSRYEHVWELPTPVDAR